METFDLLIDGISTLVTADPETTEDNPLGYIENAAIGIIGEQIRFVGKALDLDSRAFANAKEHIDAKGAVVFPGLIDSHTHPVFGGSRETEFARRIAGIPYMQIAEEGGGINYTVRKTRDADEESMLLRSKSWLDEMLRLGVTTIEAKSGYGLDTETELKQLRVIGKLDELHPIDVYATFLGAHEFPPEYKIFPEKYVDLVIEEMLPAVIDQGIAVFCDVFCEQGVFSVEQSRKILLKAREFGMKIRFHADEFVDSGGAELAAELSAIAADHLTAASDRGLEAMSEAGVIATLLPATSFYLGHGKYAEARKMIDTGITIALASDFNPGSSVSFNLPLVASIACTQMKMTFEEAILAITRNAALSLDIADRVGQIKTGLQADLLMLDIPRPEYFIYHFGRNHAWKVIKAGKVAFESPFETVFLS